MDFNFDTGTISGGLQTLDVTTLPPLGGQAGVLTVVGTGALKLNSGTTAERPAVPAAGMTRYNSESNVIEYYNGTAWVQPTSGGGTVTSVAIASPDGITVTGSPITSSGTITLTLDESLTDIVNSPAGILVSDGAGGVIPVTITGTAGNIVVTNGDGTLGNPTINLATVGTPVIDAFVKITTDTFGRVTATSAVVSGDITTILDDIYVNVDGDTMTGSLVMSTGTVVTLPDAPTAGTDAANKAYVDAVAQGFNFKEAVIAATTAADGNIDLVTGGLLTVDGIVLVAGNRVLVKNQTNDTENGIYDAAAGAWVRSSDSDTGDELVGAFVFVESGTLNGKTSWAQITQGPITIGTTSIVWSQFSAAGTYTAGTGLTLTGTEFSLTSPVLTTLGGTGTTTAPLAGQVLIGQTSGAYVPAALTQGAGIGITSASGSITIANTGVLSVTGTPGQIDVSPTTGAVTLSLPAILEIPGIINVSGFDPFSIVYIDDVGDLTSVALTDGQVLIGATGLAPVPNTLTAGTGVTITNGPGTITISTAGNVGTVTSVDVSGGTTGLTTSGGPVTSAGVITLAGTLNVASGGTGLTALGTANQVLGVNAGATAAEYKTLSAGPGISVVHGANVVTFNNTGVLSVILTDDSVVPIYTTVPTVATTGDVTASITLLTQVANTVFAGPATGVDAEPTFRALTIDDISGAIQLYKENPVTPVSPSATGDNAVAIGSGSTAEATGSFAEGDGAFARIYGQKAYANGSFAVPGDAQHGIYVLRNATTDATITELFLDGLTEQIVLPDNSLFVFDIYVGGRRTDDVGGGAGFKFLGVAKKDTTTGSVTFVGTPSKTTIGETDTPWDATVSVNLTTGALAVQVTGEAAKTINWVATVQTTEVTN